jgi:hypothetical protein
LFGVQRLGTPVVDDEQAKQVGSLEASSTSEAWGRGAVLCRHLAAPADFAATALQPPAGRSVTHRRNPSSLAFALSCKN